MKIGDIKKEIRESLGIQKEEQISEAYVANQKVFTLNTELLSTKTKTLHVELYNEYVAKFNEISAQLDSVNKKEFDANGSTFRRLKEDEQRLLNAIHLHELYFTNISDVHSELTMDSLSYMRLERDWGTFDDWQRDFIACAMASRNGWALTVFNTFLQRYVNIMIDGHNEAVPVGCYPVVVMDAWEHAYVKDYMTEKEAYIKNMMLELDWEIIENRFKRAERIAISLR